MSPVPDPALRAYYAARAREYEAVYAKPERQSDLLRLAFWLRETLADRQVLEVACGTGFWTERFAPVCRGVIACDLSEEVLVVAREKTWPEGRVRFEVAELK